VHFFIISPLSFRAENNLDHKNEYEDEKFSMSKKVQSPTYKTVVELLRSVSKWEIVGYGA
jgi:hypothetical protein